MCLEFSFKYGTVTGKMERPKHIYIHVSVYVQMNAHFIYIAELTSLADVMKKKSMLPKSGL